MGKTRFRRTNEWRTIKDLFNEFQLENKTKNLSPKTIKSYDNNLIHFFKFIELEGLTSPSDIHKTVLENFKRWLFELNIKDTTINTYLRHTRAFLYWCMDEGYFNDFKIQLIKIDEPRKEPYTEDEIKRLLAPPDFKKCGFVEWRNWLLVSYLLDTGNRLSTVINIKIKDVDLENGIVTLYTNKNRKINYSPISNTMIKNIKQYIVTWGLKNTDFLFPNEKGEQLKPRSIQSTIAKYNISRGVYETSLHKFRHTFASNYVKKGGDPLKLQRLLGHSTLTMTNHYVNLFGNDLRKDIDDISIVESLSNKSSFKRKRK